MRPLTKIKSHLNSNRIGKLKKTFIVSTGRTGTKFFESFLNNIDSNIQCIHEPSPDLFDLAIDKIRNGKKQNELISELRKARLNYLQNAVNNDKTHYIESNNNAAFLLTEIEKTFSNTRFLIIVRDPKTYVISALNKSPQNDGKFSFYDKTDHRGRLTPYDFDNDSEKKDWIEMKRFEKVSWYWNKCNNYLYDFHISSDSTLLMRYEELFAKNLDIRKDAFINMMNFFEIKINNKRLNDILERTFIRSNETVIKSIPEFELWSKTDKNKLLEITKTMRKVLNY